MILDFISDRSTHSHKRLSFPATARVVGYSDTGQKRRSGKRAPAASFETSSQVGIATLIQGGSASLSRSSKLVDVSAPALLRRGDVFVSLAGSAGGSEN